MSDHQEAETGRGVDLTPDQIRALVLDVDGVLTDGGVWWGPNGEEWKRFSFIDIMGVSLAVKAGLVLALISGEEGPLVARFAARFKITDVEVGCKDKARALRDFAERRSLALFQIAFMGDDVNDVSAMAIAGLGAAPADAHPAARDAASLVTHHAGGHGAVRELVDLILGQQGAPSKAKSA